MDRPLSSIFCENLSDASFHHIICTVFTKKNHLQYLKNENSFFMTKKWKIMYEMYF
jgi:hypothetical protein